MKVFITRNWRYNREYEVWTVKPKVWNESSGYYDDGLNSSNVLIMESLSSKQAKEMFKLDKHLKKREIIEATMTFKIKK